METKKSTSPVKKTTPKKKSPVKKAEFPKFEGVTFWRTKILVGIKSYGQGKTPEEAQQFIMDKLMLYPKIEEHLLEFQLVNGKAEKPMKYKEMLEDQTEDW